MSVLYILAAIVMLGVMVTIHEAGHFFAARLTGIPVKEFAIGFGPRLLSWRSRKHETQFFLRLIPAGGYCMFYGEDDPDEAHTTDDPRAMGNFAVWRRVIVTFMGPCMNFLLALIVAAGLFGMVGEDIGGEFGYATVRAVSENTAAAQAGIQPGDVLIAVNGQDAKGLTDDQTGYRLSALIDSYREGDAPLAVTVRRGDETLTKSMTPAYSEAEGRYLLGVSIDYAYTGRYVSVSLPRALELGGRYCVTAGGAILRALRDLVTTGAGLEETTGPLGIVTLIAEETQRSAADSAREAVITYGELLVMISVNLGLFNLLPIPGLDGSRILLLLVEGVRRKPLPKKVEAYVHLSGYVLLFGFMLFMTYRDILRIFVR